MLQHERPHSVHQIEGLDNLISSVQEGKQEPAISASNFHGQRVKSVGNSESLQQINKQIESDQLAEQSYLAAEETIKRMNDRSVGTQLNIDQTKSTGNSIGSFGILKPASELDATLKEDDKQITDKKSNLENKEVKLDVILIGKH